jgi:acetyltransferase-like isoleucine patch superfamily enzyme
MDADGAEQSNVSENADGRLPPPLWTNERTFGLLDEIGTRLERTFQRYVRFRGNKIRYLRYLGARIGTNCSIINTVPDFGTEPWLVEIGDRVTITRGVIFLTHDGSSRIFRHLVAGGSRRFGNRFAPIRVLENSFIGVNAVILPGVTIGPNSIVGASSLVTKDVPPDSVAVGNPAAVICSLEEYVSRYVERMIPIESQDRASLRRELTLRYFKETR